MPPERLTDVERQRRHREELELAIAERLPLMTARRICQERRRQARGRLTAIIPPPDVIEEPSASPFWWMRD